ncbi:hypothetical protein [Paenibacillus sp. JSM ZJ436]
MLTYVGPGFNCYEWFDSIEEMNMFIETVIEVNDYVVCEKLLIENASEIN